MYNIKAAKNLGNFDIAVYGGGIAGICSAVATARNGVKTILIESSDCPGGTMTEGLMPFVIDRYNKGGIIKEIFDFLAEHNMSYPRRSKKFMNRVAILPERSLILNAPRLKMPRGNIFTEYLSRYPKRFLHPGC